MTTPLIMIAILIGPYCLACAVCPSRRRFAAIAGISALFAFTGIGHFVKTSDMASMLPSWVPLKIPIVYVTGILEFALASLLLVPKTRRLASQFALLLLALFLPINVYAAFHHADMGGHAWGPSYLAIRIPLQIIIAACIYWFSIRTDSTSSKSTTLSPPPSTAPPHE